MFAEAVVLLVEVEWVETLLPVEVAELLSVQAVEVEWLFVQAVEAEVLSVQAAVGLTTHYLWWSAWLVR